MKKVVAIMLILSMMFLAGCAEIGEPQSSEDHDPQLHFMFIPRSDGTINTIPIFY